MDGGLKQQYDQGILLHSEMGLCPVQALFAHPLCQGAKSKGGKILVSIPEAFTF